MATPTARQSVNSGTFPATLTVTTATSGTLASAAVAGNLLLWFVAVDKNAGTFTPPSGYTASVASSGASISIAVFTKIAAGGETSASCSWATAQFGYGSIFVEYQNCAGVDVTQVPTYSDTARTSMAVGPATPTVDGLAVAVFGMDSAINTSSLSPASTGWTVYTSSYDAAPASGRPALAIDHRTAATVASTAVSSTTFTWTNSDQVQGAMVLLKGTTGTPDTTAPTVPGSVTAVADSATQVTISWTASTDAVGVTSYRIQRGGTNLSGATAVTGTSFADTTVSASTTYSYTVSAVDAAGNRSAESTAANATTPAGGGGPTTPTFTGTVTTLDSAVASASEALTVPTGRAVGEILLAFILTGASGGTITTPSGWTAIQNAKDAFGGAGVALDVNMQLAYRVVDGSEPASYTWSWTSTTYKMMSMVRVAGVNTSSPIRTSAAKSTNSTKTTTDVGPSLTGVQSTDVEVYFWGGGDDAGAAMTAPTGPTSPWTTLFSRANSVKAQIVSSTTGAVAAPTATSSSANTVWASIGVALAASGGGGTSPTLSGRVVGISDQTVGRVTAITDATSARLKVGTDTAVTSGVIFGSTVNPNAGGAAPLTVTGLTAGTQYYYRVMMTNALGGEFADTASTVGSFKTAPTGQTSFAFNFGSCTNGTDSAAMTAVAARGDDLFLHLGDLFYSDGTATTAANFRTAMKAKITVANHAAVFATTPTVYEASDHDSSFSNDGSGATDATGLTNFNSVYRELWSTPTLPGGTSGTYYTFAWGRVRFICCDTRTFKSANGATDNSSKTILGATQKQWVKDTITAATESLIFITSDTPWIGSTGDNWAVFTTERAELGSFYAASGKKVILLCGDIHVVAADDGTNSTSGIPVFEASALNNTSEPTGTWSAGNYPTGTGTASQLYGRVVITDTGSSIAAAFTGYSSDNTSRITLTKTYTLTTSASVTATAASTATIAGVQQRNAGLLATANASMTIAGIQTNIVTNFASAAAGSVVALGVRTQNGTLSSTASGAAVAAGVQTNIVTNSASAAAGSAVVLGVRTQNGTLSSTADGGATAAGTTTTTAALNSAGTATASIAGVLSQISILTATVQASSAISGLITAIGSLTATAAGSNAIAGQREQLATVSSSVSAVSTVAAIREQLATLQSTSTVNATIAAVREQFATVSSTASAVSNIAAIREQLTTLSSTASAVSTISAVPLQLATLSSTASAVSTIAAIREQIAVVSSTASAVSTIAAVRVQLATLQSTSAANAAVAGTRVVLGTIASGAAAQASVTVFITANLQTTVAATASISPQRTMFRTLTATASALAVVIGIAVRQMSGSAAIDADATGTAISILRIRSNAPADVDVQGRAYVISSLHASGLIDITLSNDVYATSPIRSTASIDWDAQGGLITPQPTYAYINVYAVATLQQIKRLETLVISGQADVAVDVQVHLSVVRSLTTILPPLHMAAVSVFEPEEVEPVIPVYSRPFLVIR